MSNKILIAKPTFNPLVETDPNKFIFHSDYSTLKYFAEGSVRINGTWITVGTLQEQYIQQYEDDCFVEDGNIYGSGSPGTYLDFVSFGKSAAGKSRNAGLVFRNMNIAQGRQVQSAYLYLPAFDDQSGVHCMGRIYGENNSNPAAFSSYADFIGRSKTTHYVNWDDVDPWESFMVYKSPNIATVIQEIIDRGDWSPGKSIGLFIYDNPDVGSDTGARRNFMAFDYTFSMYYSAYLEINFVPDPPKIFTTPLAHGLGYTPQFDVSVDRYPGLGGYNIIPYINSLITIGSEIASVWADDNYLYFEVQLRPGLTTHSWDYDFTFFYKLYKNRLGI